MLSGGRAAWERAVRAAQELQARHPRWRVTAIHLRGGVGVSAWRDGSGTCCAVGNIDEVRAVLRRADRALP